MLITVDCPGCKTRYRLSDSLLGKVIRCTKESCRTEFAVGEQPPEAPPEQPGSAPVPPGAGARGGSQQWTGSINDFVPLLPAEPADLGEDHGGNGTHYVGDMLPIADAEIEPPAGQAVEASWNQPPPVRNAPRAFAPPPVTEPPPKKPARNGQRKAGADRATQMPPQASRTTQIEPPPTFDSEPAPEPPAAPPAPSAVDFDDSEPPSGPVEMPAGAWETGAPPVRQADAAAAVAPANESTAEAAVALAIKKRKRSTRLMIALGVMVPLVAIAGFVVFKVAYGKSEDSRRAAAYEAFNQLRYANAADDFADVGKRFPSSARADEYRDMEELSRVLGSAVNVSPTDADDALDRLGGYAGKHKADPLVQEHAAAIGKVAAKLMGDVIEAEKANPTDVTPARMDKVQFVLGKVHGIGPKALDPDARERFETGVSEVRLAHNRWARRRNTRNNILALIKDPSLPPVQVFKDTDDILRTAEREFPGFGQDPEIRQAFEGLYERHLAQVKYVPADGAPPETPPAVEVPYPTIVFAPRVDGSPAARTKDDAGVVLSLVHGVLYAHSRGTGKVLWFVRVGVDTTTLPIRVPETASSPERILVQLADSRILVAFNPGGEEVWRYKLDTPFLGRPVVVEPSVLVPTYGGKVHEVELAGGRLVGQWDLGQPLSAGGARQGRENIVYFPAEGRCVYVLNVDPKNRHCQRILYSNHPAGSLRGEPLVVAPVERSFDQQSVTLPGFLILDQTEGLLSTQMRVFSLPLADRTGPPLALKPEPRMSGWTWFTPLNDSEKVVAVTDDGTLAIFGIQQLGNDDPALFPLVPTLVNLDDLLKPEGKARDRAQVVNLQGDDFWVLSRGKLLRLTKTWNAAVGPKLVAGWNEPLELGSPLHASQVEPNRAAGYNTLVVVTQARKNQSCLASAVRDDDGTLLWQRDVGLVCHGSPVLLQRPAPAGGAPAGDAAPAAPVVLTMGASGELYAFDPAVVNGPATKWYTSAQGSLWTEGSRWLVDGGGPLDDNPDRRPLLLAARDGRSAYEIAYPGAGHTMVVRHVGFDETGKVLKKEEKSIKLPAGAVAKGPPALLGDSLVVALSSGDLFRVGLSPPAAEGKRGMDWRSPRIGSDAPGYVVALGPDTFVSTDGGKGLLYWKVDDKGTMYGILTGKPDDDSHGLELDDRVVAPPVLLPRADNAPPVLVVACARGIVRTVRGTPDTKLEEAKARWDLHGNVTVGPFVVNPPGVGPRVGLVVDGRKVVWLDPKKGGEPLWEYPTTGAAIVGEPQVVDGRLLVADQNGKIAALDLATGAAAGDGYDVPGSAAATAPPVAFGPDTLLTPLTDGTVVLLPMKLFRAK